MLSAVSQTNPTYQTPGGHYLGGGPAVRNPVGGVPSGRPASARQPNRPGQETPGGAPLPIPTSTAKPGNREGNQRIPYARMMFTWGDAVRVGDSAAPRDLQAGDVVFTHRSPRPWAVARTA